MREQNHHWLLDFQLQFFCLRLRIQILILLCFPLASPGVHLVFDLGLVLLDCLGHLLLLQQHSGEVLRKVDAGEPVAAGSKEERGVKSLKRRNTNTKSSTFLIIQPFAEPSTFSTPQAAVEER